MAHSNGSALLEAVFFLAISGRHPLCLLCLPRAAARPAKGELLGNGLLLH